MVSCGDGTWRAGVSIVIPGVRILPSKHPVCVGSCRKAEAQDPSEAPTSFRRHRPTGSREVDGDSARKSSTRVCDDPSPMLVRRRATGSVPGLVSRRRSRRTDAEGAIPPAKLGDGARRGVDGNLRVLPLSQAEDSAEDANQRCPRVERDTDGRLCNSCRTADGFQFSGKGYVMMPTTLEMGTATPERTYMVMIPNATPSAAGVASALVNAGVIA